MIIYVELNLIISFDLFSFFSDTPPSKTSRLTLLYNYELRDLIKFSLLCICTVILTKYDSSMAYHEIRTQSVIKIYIFFNLLEVSVFCIYFEI